MGLAHFVAGVPLGMIGPVNLMAEQLARLRVYKMDLRTRWANDDLVLIEQRRLVELIQHARLLSGK